MNLPRLLEPCFSPGAVRFRRLVEGGGVRWEESGGRRVLGIDPGLLSRLAFEAFRDVNFLFRTPHLEQWAAILGDPRASENDRYVAAVLLRNAAISAEGVLPACQDTGTAAVIGMKGEDVRTGADDEQLIAAGVREAYATCNLRFSQVAPVSLFEEEDTRSNLPAQIDIYSAPAGSPGGAEYRFLFIAKGGGSANKTAFFQETKALLNEASLEKFLREKVRALGTAGCPPYHLAAVIGGSSAEENLKILKLATAGALDAAPFFGEVRAGAPPEPGQPFRDAGGEERLVSYARETGFGAQFGGAFLALDARVVRLARHAASLPVSIGVSCSAHRNALARVGDDGAWIEDFDRDPSRFLPRALPVISRATGGAARVDLDRPIREVCAELSRYPVGTLVLLSGPMAVARDAAHARLARMLREGQPLPRWLSAHPVYYAGPARTPPGGVIGSFGPTTAQRMDPYVRSFQSRGASLVMLAKGNRSAEVAESCREFGGFSLGTIGGAAAVIARENIVREQVLAFPELGMEAVRRIEVKDLPAFVVIDDKGNTLSE